MSRTSPLPSMHKFEKVGIEEALKKQFSKDYSIGGQDNSRSAALPNLVSQSRQATPEEERQRILELENKLS